MTKILRLLINFVKKFKVIFIFIAVCLLFLVAYTVVSVMAAKKQITIINEKYKSEIAMEGIEYPKILNLRKESAFIQARLELAKYDSVTLIVDLVDSLVLLDLKGVIVHQAKIIDFTKSEVLASLSNEAVVNIMASPMHIINQTSTIVKVPKKIVIAPKDTIEAANNVVARDTLDLNPSFYYFELDNGFEISIIHEQKEGYSYFPLILNQKIKVFKETIRGMRHFKLPEYIPGIKIELKKADAKTVFRALPHQATVILRM